MIYKTLQSTPELSAKAALTRGECEIYADYLEAKGDIQGAEFFRRADETGLNR